MYENFADNILLIGHKTRLTMLIELSSGKALPAGELAKLAGVKPQTASEHLSKLVEANLISVNTWGRHRYYKIDNDKVVDAINALAVISPPMNSKSLKETTKKEKLSYCRTCYGHIAGKVGVEFTDSLLRNDYLEECEGYYKLTENGKIWLGQLGLETERNLYTKPIPKHLDWTERKYHIAGPISLKITKMLIELSWLQVTEVNRCLKVTRKGEESFKTQLNMIT
ncbi:MULTISPECIES: ArsR/SmtB family transcription factor [Staphylococcus]|uniref:ArsR/SmtB family transcription factor n=1 Tax=Staphylococcus TaxID=1279 RepID=UPI00024634D9|nr:MULTISPECIES: winged helix-turn-helix domain-containing protein [Staphylococcus]QAV30886.1 ArsR family transcriptional regulator [Sulfitobacter donghicola]KAB7644607.1 winged helix-turn-helix transcriptional regulator [Staphylococcus sp. B2-b]MBN6854063.1 winged helix-turn-helix transcriptional regulator [Staphylococcus warneri]MBT2769879.1 winged helix-turn-helix transcriptional regulator [Staphylococcus warneri]MBX7839935.1 winged helix-turn-helix domain-containing protein [Staphylococcus